MKIEVPERQKHRTPTEPTAPPAHEADAAPDRPVRGRMVAIVVYVALSIGLYFVLAPTISDQEQLRSHLEAAGAGGVLSYVLLYSAQMFIPWLPGAPLDIIGGATFGFWETVLLSSACASASGLLIYLAVRQVGLEAIVERFPGLLESPWRLVKIIKKRPWLLIAVNMLTGDVAYFIAGAAGTPLPFTMVLLGIMRVPSVMVGVALGAGIISNAIQQKLDTMVAIATIGTICTLLIGFAIARRYLPGLLERWDEASGNTPEPANQGQSPSEGEPRV